MIDPHHDSFSNSGYAGSSTSSHTPQVSSQQPHQNEYEGFDPELPEGKENSKFLGLSSVQIGASAAAAVTSALAASFFGVAGTLIGAAVGSVISTIAGAMYAESMRRAGGRMREAQTVVIQREPLRGQTRPTQVPRPETVTQVMPAQADQTIVLPAEPGTKGELPVAAGASGMPSGPGTKGRTGRPWWRRPPIALPIVGLLGFVIAIGVITGIEELTGHRVSGGSGTSVSSIGGGGSAPKPSPSVTVTVTTTSTAQDEPAPSGTTSATEAPQTPAATGSPSADQTTPPVTSTSADQDQSATTSPASVPGTGVNQDSGVQSSP